MPQIKISDLPLYTGNTSGSYLVMNNSGQTTTYKVSTNTLLDELPTTGSNRFVGNQIITGSLTVSGSVVSFNTQNVRITGSSTFGDLVITNVGKYANAQIVVSSTSTNESSKINLNSKGTGASSEIQLNHISGSVMITKSENTFEILNSYFSSTGSVSTPFFSIGNNTSLSLLAEPQFKRSLGITGSVNISTVMKLAQQSTLPSGTVGSLAVSGSNLFYHNGSSWSQIN